MGQQIHSGTAAADCSMLTLLLLSPRLTVPVEVAMTCSRATLNGQAMLLTARTAATSASMAAFVAGTGFCSSRRKCLVFSRSLMR